MPPTVAPPDSSVALLLGGRISRDLTRERVVAYLAGAFAVLTLVLSSLGLYGVLSYGVARRTREIGVRTALGATRPTIVAMVVGEGLTLAGLGIAAGLAGAVVASRAIGAMLFGVSRLDPATYLGVVVVLAGVALLAAGVPAWRAAQVDPASTLRAE